MPVTRQTRCGHLPGGILLRRTPHSSFGHKRPNTSSFALREFLLAAHETVRPSPPRPCRVNRDDFSGTLQIDTIGTTQLNEPLSVAAAHHCLNAVLLRASRFCRICRDTFLGGCSHALRVDSFESSVGVPIKLFGHASVRERRTTIRSHGSPAVSGCPTPTPTHFSLPLAAPAPGIRCHGPRRTAWPCRCPAFLPPG